MSTDSSLNDRVKKELCLLHVKLWLPPYYDKENVVPDHKELQQLAAKLGSNKLKDISIEDILSALEYFQSHALEKKKLKNLTAEKRSVSVEIKILGRRGDLDGEACMQQLTSWANGVTVSPKSITLQQLDPMLTVSQVLGQLEKICSASQVRLVHKGKPIVSSTDEKEARLSNKILAGGTKKKSKSSVLLCLVSYSDKEEKYEEKKEDAPTADSVESPDYTLISSIRNAATKLQSGANFEITDQHGNNVSMLHTERLAFVTALGLHRLGRKRMDDGDINSMPSALVFLLEADQEWNHVKEEWRNKVDNYGLLQLDICWAYLKLESLDNLPDVTRRLQVAETALRKQVDPNFVTLALVQAEMGNPVFPQSAVFVRLFLLQGIAYRYSNDADKSKERLDWAMALSQSLRAVSNEDAVSSLCEAVVGTTKSTAISALRRTNGDVNAAATLMEQDKQDAVQKRYERELQHEIGLCENTMDLVNLDLVPQLQSMLGLPASPPPQDQPFGAAALQQMDDSFMVTANLLRLANNDLEKAISLNQEMQGNLQVLMGRASALDRRLEEQGVTRKRSRKRSRDDEFEDVLVDEVALATLVSMGVNDKLAKKALQRTSNNVEMSLLWLSNRDESAKRTASDENLNVAESYPGGEPPQEHDAVDENKESDTSDTQEADIESNTDAHTGEEEEAEILLEKELADVLGDRDLEKEYLGNSLDEEWDFINKFRQG